MGVLAARPHTLSSKDGDVRRVPVPGAGRATPRRRANTYAPHRPYAQPTPATAASACAFGVGGAVCSDRVSTGMPELRTGPVVAYGNGKICRHGVPASGGSVRGSVIHIGHAETQAPGRRAVDHAQAALARGQVRSTPPWAQRDDRWPFGGAFVLSFGHAEAPLFRGGGMT